MRASELEEFLVSLPEPRDYEDKHLYIFGIGNSARLYQEGFAREDDLNIRGYSVSNFGGGGGLYSAKDYSLLLNLQTIPKP